MNDENKKEIIDLVPCGDGTYTTKEEKHKSVPIKVEKPKIQKQYTGVKPPNRDNMDQLFMGMDIGLEFVESMEKRIKRIRKLYK